MVPNPFGKMCVSIAVDGGDGIRQALRRLAKPRLATEGEDYAPGVRDLIRNHG